MSLLREKLERGEYAVGTHVSMNEPIITEMLGNLGFDYIWIDTEHTTISLDALQNHLIAARAANVPSVVRIAWNDPVRAKPVLEMGPDGIVFPQLRSYDEALLAVQSCLYPPEGIRGVGPGRAVNFGTESFRSYLARANRETLIILQIEHVDMLRELPEIVKIPRADVFLIGPMDFAGSMGMLHDTGNPLVQQKIDEAIAIVQAAGKTVGLSIGDISAKQMESWKARGVQMISVGKDATHIVRGGQAVLEKLRAVFAGNQQVQP